MVHVSYTTHYDTYYDTTRLLHTLSDKGCASSPPLPSAIENAEITTFIETATASTGLTSSISTTTKPRNATATDRVTSQPVPNSLQIANMGETSAASPSLLNKQHNATEKCNPTNTDQQRKKADLIPRLSSPVMGIRVTPNGSWKENQKNGAVFSEEEVMQRVISHVSACSARESCVDVYGCARNCSCLHALVGKERVITNCARGLLGSYYGVATAEGKTRFVITQMRHAAAYAKVLKEYVPRGCALSYLVPYEEDEHSNESGSGDVAWDASESQIFLCTWGFCSLLSIGRDQYKRYSRTNPVIPVKTTIRKGNTNRLKSDEIYESLRQYIGELIHHALPMSAIPSYMRKRKRTTTATTRGGDPQENGNDEGEILFLSPEFKYLRLYKDWCMRRGKVVKFKSAREGYFYPTDQYDDRLPHDSEWPLGSVSKDVVSFKTFQDYWKRTFPNLKVQVEAKRLRRNISVPCP